MGFSGALPEKGSSSLSLFLLFVLCELVSLAFLFLADYVVNKMRLAVRERKSG